MSDPTTIRRRRAVRLLNAGVAFTALVALVVGCSAESAPRPDASPSATASATPAPTQSADSVALPRTAMAAGIVNAWTLAGQRSVAEAGPEVGDASDGAVALRIDAPVVGKTKTVAFVEATVAPGTKYRFTADARVLSETLEDTGASFRVGGKGGKLPELNAEWTKIAWDYETDADESALSVRLRVSKPVLGLSVDNITLVPVGSDQKKVNAVPNGSFEAATVESGIVNTSLVMSTATAAVAVSTPPGEVAWRVSHGGQDVAEGTANAQGSLTAIPLTVAVTQGLYTLEVTPAGGETTKTTIAVIDSPDPWIDPDARFGVGLHVESADLYADAARHVRALGLSGVRYDIRWERNEKAPQQYDFPAYDGPYAALHASDVAILGILDYGNPLYGKSNAFAPTTPAGLAAYGDYAAEIAARYDLDGLEVFNEFNWPSHNKSGCLTPECYLPLVEAVDSAVSEVDPSLPIVVGGTAKFPRAWFEDLWDRGALEHADVMSFHPYEVTGAPEDLAAIMTQARATMQKQDDPKPIWITELGTSSAKGGRTTTEQASVLLRGAVTAVANGAARFYWYNLINDGPNQAEHYENFGLYNHPVANVAALAPKPAAFTQALTVAQLGGRPFRATESAGAGVVSHVFGTEADSVRVVWSPKGAKTATIPSDTPVVVVASDGTTTEVAPEDGNVVIRVTPNPVFVRGGTALSDAKD